MENFNVNVDLLGKNGGIGPIAMMFANNGQLNAGSMRPFIDDETGGAYISIYRGGDPTKEESYIVRPFQSNATLRRDEWKTLDDAVMTESRYRLGAVQDLIDLGLVYNLGNGMGTTVLEYHDIGGSFDAELSMDAITRAKNDRPEFKHNYLPLPFIHVDYQINMRELQVSRNMSNPLDTSMAEFAARAVSEKLENMLMKDESYSYGEKDSYNKNTIYSYVNHPDRILYSLGTAWDSLDFDSETADGGKIIVAQVNEMIQKSIDNRHYGPWGLYIPTAYQTLLDGDYKANGDMTIRDRLLKLNNLRFVKVNDTLAANNVLLVQLTKDVVRLVRGMGITNIEWKTEGIFTSHYKVITIQVPQIRSDINGRTGIVHASV